MYPRLTETAWDAAWQVVELVPGDLSPEERRDLFRKCYDVILAALQRHEWLRSRSRPDPT